MSPVYITTKEGASDTLPDVAKLSEHLAQGTSQLVRAGCRLRLAAYAFETGYDILDLHAADKRCNALRVAVATAVKRHILHYSILHLNIDGPGTCSFCLINKSHIIQFFVKRTHGQCIPTNPV